MKGADGSIVFPSVDDLLFCVVDSFIFSRGERGVYVTLLGRTEKRMDFETKTQKGKKKERTPFRQVRRPRIVASQ